MNWLELVIKIINILASSGAVALATYGATQSVEGTVVAGIGSAVNHLRDNPLTPSQPLPSINPNVKLLMLILFLLFPIMGKAQEVEAVTILQWDRNVETDMAFYNVYACTTKGCVVTKQSTKSANIPQPAVGVIPQWTLPMGEGTVAVTATDTSNNESELSVSLPFDRLGPKPPFNVRAK